jgi:hypothetical protein
MLLDGLWFAGILTNKQRKDATHDLRRLVYGLGREIIDLERRARESAARAGTSELMQEADGETRALVLATGSLVDADDAVTAEDRNEVAETTGPPAADD